MADSILNKKSVCVITGPTRGLGRSIAHSLSKQLPPDSLFILLSRSEPLLTNIADAILQVEGMRAVTAVFDQGSSSQAKFDTVIQNCLAKAEAQPDEFEQAILVNNAGTLELLDHVRDLDDLASLNAYFTTNVTGCIVLTSKFLQIFNSNVKSRVVINISSLAAISPMKSWLVYCMAKASRDMMIKVVGEEEENIRTLNYAPGPLVTDMTDIACKDTKDVALRNWFQEQIRNKTLVECDASAKKLIMILEKNMFENGAHIDYYDEV